MLLTKKPTKTKKILILHSGHTEIFFEELTHDFGEKSVIFLFVFVFNKISREIMSHDHLVKKQALLDYKKWILHSCNIGIFFEKG